MTATLALVPPAAGGNAPAAFVAQGLLRSAVEAMAAGTTDALEPAVAEVVRLAMQLAQSSSSTDRLCAAHGLSDREREVLDLVSRGFSTKQIARALFLSDSTVTFHLGRIYAKTGVHTRHELTDLVWAADRAA